MLTAVNRPPTNRSLRVGLLLGAAVSCLVGSWLIVWNVGDIRGAREVKKWPTAVGTVTGSAVIGDRAIRPLIIYTYRVGDTSFIDSTSLGIPSFGNRRIRLDESDKLAAEYAAGDSVTVYYNPQRPGRSQLYAREDWASYVRLSLGVILGMGGLVLAARHIRR